MNLGLDVFRAEDMGNDTVLVNEIGSTDNANGLASASHLFAPASKFLQQASVGIGNERKREPVGIGKLLRCRQSSHRACTIPRNGTAPPHIDMMTPRAAVRAFIVTSPRAGGVSMNI